MTTDEVVAAGEKALARTGSDAPSYVGRVGICYIEVEHKGDDKALYSKIIAALNADSRVEKIYDQDADKKDFARIQLSLLGPFGEDEAPDPFSHVDTFNFRNAIAFRARIPRRLQTIFENFKHIPSETYWVAWDGLTLVTIWEVEKISGGENGSASSEADIYGSLSPSGGMAILDILNDLAKKCGYNFTTSPCSPVCSYPYSHTELVFELEESAKGISFHKFNNEDYTCVIMGKRFSKPEDVVLLMHRRISLIGRVFAKVTGAGMSLSMAGQLAHSDATELLKINYGRAQLGRLPWWKSFKERWEFRGWRERSRRLIARLNLTLATLEHTRSEWMQMRRLYESYTENGSGIGLIFDREYRRQTDMVTSVEVAEARSTLERLTGSLDMRALVVATMLGAIAGAIVAALISILT